MNRTLVFATRPSKLAGWQTATVIWLLKNRFPGLDCLIVVMRTEGDKVLDKPLQEIGGKGLFTLELEEALLDGRVDVAVHSLKDLPTESPEGLTIASIPERGPVHDVLIAPCGLSLDELPSGAVVGTSSVRRTAQLLAYRDDLVVEPIRGNVDTRIRKAEEGQYDAIVLAAAGVERLGLEDRITEHLALDIMVPAPGQGAMAVQCRSNDTATISQLQSIMHSATFDAVTAERSFLSALDSGCSTPVGAYSVAIEERVSLHGIVLDPDGSRAIRVTAEGADPREVGIRAAQRALDDGAGELLP